MTGCPPVAIAARDRAQLIPGAEGNRQRRSTAYGVKGGLGVTWYVGLTDDPERRRGEHGNPPDWKQTTFNSEVEARTSERGYTSKPGYQGAAGGSGWRYGYWYTITAQTVE